MSVRDTNYKEDTVWEVGLLGRGHKFSGRRGGSGAFKGADMPLPADFVTAVLSNGQGNSKIKPGLNLRFAQNRSMMSVPSKDTYNKEESNLLALDVLTLKVLSLQLSDNDDRYYAIQATFSNQIVLSGIIKPTGMREEANTDIAIAQGTFSYSPSDYEKISSFANTPLVVSVQPLKTFESHSTSIFKHSSSGLVRKEISSARSPHKHMQTQTHISTCNVDILPIFIEENIMCIKKRMEPLVTQSVLQQKSWDSLPLITMKLSVQRDPENAEHNKLLGMANHMKITVVGLYNMLFPYDYNYTYTLATQIPVASDAERPNVIIFSKGGPSKPSFNNTIFFPNWESLRASGEPFAKGDDKFTCDVQKLEKINTYDVDYYFSPSFSRFTTIWASTHRSLILQSQAKGLWHTFRQWKWPLEVTMTAEYGVNYTFMAFIDLFRLCYPGVNKVCLAVPLSWYNHWTMKEQCDCYHLIAAYDKTSNPAPKANKPTNTNSARSTSTETGGVSGRPTGGDEGSAFIILEVSLARPLVSVKIPPEITTPEIFKMLADMESISADKRMCTARGQQTRDWQTTVRLACNALRRVPHYGTTEFCLFNRQLSETRTRVELFTSCWLDAAVYVNNNFVVQEFLKSNEMYEEMLMMSHACLMKVTNDTLLGVARNDVNPRLRAARHARHMQDLPHAMELYMVLVSKHSYNADYWRELSTCMKEIDRDWASYCLDKALLLNIRHPLTLLSKACMVCEENPDAAEPFFMAILTLYPFWQTAWVAASAYFLSRELYHMADQVLAGIKLSQQIHRDKETEYPRSWEYELGDWWEQAPLLPGMSHYFDAADLLLRLRALNLAEVCVARSLVNHGPSAAYFYFLALCCRLQNRVDEALCHTKRGLEQFGEVSYLKNLEGECYHKQGNIGASIASFEKAGACMNSYNVLLSLHSREASRVRSILVDLLRRQPNAYAWMALCEDWVKRTSIGEGGDGNLTEEQRSAMVCATACAIQALKWDRRAGRAWAHLAASVHPSARRLFCRNMASSCGHYMSEDRFESDSPSKQSLSYRIGVAYLACGCTMCAPVHL